MKLEWIRCFHEIALTGSISKAAQKLFITQPAATKMIHSLEAELGETLLIRTSSGVTFTEQGVIFLKYCQQVLNSYEN
ncbi:MAG: LysR family transcriptional regulator, partial [Peptococcaceae bacterium]|nr:LysR family transcriptional regulator [Peptococcaceae bacterium]